MRHPPPRSAASPGNPTPRVFTLEPESLGAAGLQEVMGVPIAAVLECDTEREAFEVVVEQKVLAFVEGADKLCVLCDACSTSRVDHAVREFYVPVMPSFRSASVSA